MATFPTLPDFDPTVGVTADDLDALVAALEFLYRPPVCVVVTSVTADVPDGVSTLIEVDAEIKDTDNMFSGGTPGRITFKTAGTFGVQGTGNWAPAAGGVVRAIEVWLNGVTRIANVDGPPLGASTEVGQTTPFVIRDFVVGPDDYIELFGYQDSGGVLGVDATLTAVFQTG